MGTSDQNTRKQVQNGNHSSKATPVTKKAEAPVPDSKPTSYLHLPHMHRPTKEELLAAATGFWSRLKVRFKWFSIRRPGQGKTKVRKGSSMSAAAEAAAERQAELGGRKDEEEEDTNYTQFDLTIGTVNVTLSFVKWWNGKGLLRDVEVKGVRGVVDRTSVHWSGEYVDPKTYRHEHHPGDFEIDSFKMEDLLV